MLSIVFVLREPCVSGAKLLSVILEGMNAPWYCVSSIALVPVWVFHFLTADGYSSIGCYATS